MVDGATPHDGAAYVFDQTQVRTYDIRVDPADLAAIDAEPAAEAWVPASLLFEGTVYGPLEMRYKGSSAAFVFPCVQSARSDPKAHKCSIKLGFDRVDAALRFFGLEKLNFHAMIRDPSLLRERLGYSLFNDHGVSAPRAVHARVRINGKLEGLFVAVEQIDRRFAEARFSDGDQGHVFKEVWPGDATEARFRAALETDKSKGPSMQPALDFQAAVLTSADATTRFVDRDYHLRYLAVDRLIIHDDGPLHFYCRPEHPHQRFPHNFYWYQSTDAPRFWLIPWDLDLTLNTAAAPRIYEPWHAPATSCACTRYGSAHYQITPSCDPLVRHFISWRAEYELEVDRLLAGAFSEQRIEAKLRAWTAQIQPYVVEAASLAGAPGESGWHTAVQQLRDEIRSARRHRGRAY